MTKTFDKTASGYEKKYAELGMMVLGSMADGSLVWIFEFGSLGFV